MALLPVAYGGLAEEELCKRSDHPEHNNDES